MSDEQALPDGDLYFIWDRTTGVRPAELLEWARWFKNADRRLAEDVIGGCRISTVFLGLNHAFGPGPPILWETMVFSSRLLDGEEDRYATEEEARAGHAAMVARVRAALEDGDAAAEHMMA